jgi:MobA/MobL family
MRQQAPCHVRVKIIGRTASKVVSAPEAAAYRSGTAVAGSVLRAAAYRAGERLHGMDDVGKEVVHDYTRKSDVLDKGIVLPEGEAQDSWARNRSKLWNGIEVIEKRKDAQLAREVEVMLPRELTFDQQKALLLGYIKAEFTSKGMVADYAIHSHTATDGGEHPHAHILLPLRRFENGAFSETKTREWNSREMVYRWRSEWAAHVNSALEAAGHVTRIDHRSLRAQGIDRTPQHTRGKVGNALYKAQKEFTPSATLAKERYAAQKLERNRAVHRQHYTMQVQAQPVPSYRHASSSIAHYRHSPRTQDYDVVDALQDLMQSWMKHTILYGMEELCQSVFHHVDPGLPNALVQGLWDAGKLYYDGKEI